MKTSGLLVALGVAFTSGAAIAQATTPADPAQKITPQEQQEIALCLGNSPASLDAQLATCDRLIKSGRYTGTNLAIAHYSRGYVYSQKNDSASAMEDYNEAIKLAPAYTRAYLSRGNASLIRKDFDKAIADFSEVIKLEPSAAIGFNNRGFAYQAKNDLDKALADYTQALKIEPNANATLINRGDIHRLKKDYTKAIADYDAALSGDRNNALALYRRGLAKQAKGDKPGGDKDIADAKKINPAVQNTN